MKLIVITPESHMPGEEHALNCLFAEGLSRLHLRKPAMSEADTRCYLQNIDARYRCRIVLHDHYALAREMALAGVHFNHRNQHLFTAYKDIAISQSVHTIAELEAIPASIHYTLFSPIFDSISKEGYKHAFTAHKLSTLRQRGLIHQGIIALGGITAERIPQVADWGFGGVALLGSFWNEWMETADIEMLLANYRKLRAICHPYKVERIARLHYISKPHITEVDDFVDSSVEMLRAGVPLIQIRNKRMTTEQIAAVASAVRPAIQRFNKTLIINDNPAIALSSDADGVHLGKNDMPVADARRLLGDNFIIGGTANTFEDIKALCEAGVDYIGLGPFRFTTTKDNLSPILGIRGFQAILEQCKAHGLTIPVIAIGGITQSEVNEVMQTGVYGIAMSGGLQADDFAGCQQRINNILNTIQRYE